LKGSIYLICRPAWCVGLESSPCGLKRTDPLCAIPLWAESARGDQVIKHRAAFELKYSSFGKGDDWACEAPEILKDFLSAQ